MASNLQLTESWLDNNSEPHVLRWQNFEGQSGVLQDTGLVHRPANLLTENTVDRIGQYDSGSTFVSNSPSTSLDT